MTADGSEDNKITSRSLKDYKITPPLNIPFVGTEPKWNLSYIWNGKDEDKKEVLGGDRQHPPHEDLKWKDLEIDRLYDDELWEFKFRALYDNDGSQKR